jgi:hypothetical protein
MKMLANVVLFINFESKRFTMQFLTLALPLSKALLVGGVRTLANIVLTMVGLNRKKSTTLKVAILAFAQWFDLLYVVTLT